MANTNLTNAKKAKNDEFYTQYNDIQKEIEAYLEYNSDAFRGKVVYCNCDDPFESNFFQYFASKFNELGLKKLITTSYKGSPIAFTQTTIPGIGYPDKVVVPVKGRAQKAMVYEINEVKDFNYDGSINITDIQYLVEHDKNITRELHGDSKYPAGDFRSVECVNLLKQSDIVVTNPPFSLYRKYVEQLNKYNKKFVIIGGKNTITYKEIFPLIKDNKMWVGTTSFNKDMLFIAPSNADFSDKPKTAIRKVDGIIYLRSPSVWFTNLDHGRRHQPLELSTMTENLKHNKKLKSKEAYVNYDNYDALEVPFTDAIPRDYDGLMGVPISFLDKYSPEQFEIIGASDNGVVDDKYKLPHFKKHNEPYVNGSKRFKRIFIMHKKN